MSDIKGAAHDRGVTAEVHPGGALAALTFSPAALDLGAAVLARTVVDVIATATAQANQRTKHALRLTGIDPAVLGLSHDTALTEEVESTVPTTWRVR